MKPLNLKIENLGKIKFADIQVGGLTIFAGKNDTGKSFASRTLYSLLRAFHDSYQTMRSEIRLDFAIAPILRILGTLSSDVHVREIQDLHTRIKELIDWTEVKLLFASHNIGDAFAYLKSKHPNAEQILADARVRIPRALSVLRNEENREELDEVDEDWESAMSEMCDFLRNPAKAMTGGVVSNFRRQLLVNFVARPLSSLIKIGEGSADISLDACRMKIDNDKIFTDSAEMKFDSLPFARAYYLESPIYWKLKPTLDEREGLARYGYRAPIAVRRSRLSAVPAYYHTLSAAINRPFIDGGNGGKSKQDELLAKIAKIVGGKLKINKSGNLFFQTREAEFPISTAAMGIANIGMIGLLLEQNLLDKNAFLFVDEPEAHLHPEWKKEMGEILYRLAASGVRVVIATHSMEIVKAMEVIAKKDENAKKIISINHFVDGEVKRYDGDFDKAVDNILEDLTEPFAGLYLEAQGDKL